MLRTCVALRSLQYSTQVHRQVSLSLSNNDTARQGIKANELLQKLSVKLKTKEFQLVELAEDDSNDINSDRSLPMTKFPKQKIFNEVANDANIATWRKGAVKWIRLGVHMMRHYRNGLQDTYRVAKSTKNLKADVRLGAETALATQMSKLIEFSEIQVRLFKNPIEIPLTRKQFVEYHRRGQVWKIPTFFLIALVLEELTVALCYFFPKVAPHNCLTPGAYLKISRSHAIINNFTDPTKYCSPYGLAKETLFRILQTSPILHTPRWKLKVYDLIDNKRQPCETLVHIHQYLFVDDWLLLKGVLGEKPTRLSYKELVNCILERQLYLRGEDLNAMVNDDIGRQILIWRLFLYWSFRFDKTVTVGGDRLFSEKWGVNNVSILNYTGLEACHLLRTKDLPALKGNL